MTSGLLLSRCVHWRRQGHTSVSGQSIVDAGTYYVHKPRPFGNPSTTSSHGVTLGFGGVVSGDDDLGPFISRPFGALTRRCFGWVTL